MTALEDFVQGSGALKAVVARADGTVLEAVGVKSGDREVLPKSASIAFRLGKVLEQYGGMGGLSSVWIQFEGGLFLTKELGGDVLLMVLTGPGASVGMVRYHINRFLGDLVREYGGTDEDQAQEEAEG